MASRVERELEEKAERLLFDKIRNLGGISVKIHPLVKGNPDRLIIWHSMYLVELKRPGEDISLAQRAWHVKARKAGADVYTVIGTEGVRSWVRALVAAHTAPRGPGRPRADCTCRGKTPEMKFFRETRVWDGSEEHPGDE